MVEFAGWEMPVEYTGITQEHLAVRGAAGLFDVSHMGEIEIAGKDALAAVQSIFCNDAAKLQIGQAHYSGLLTPDGTFVDDLLVYRLAPAHFMRNRTRLEARPRRKRNVDGGVPPMGLMTEPLMFLKRSDSRADARLKDHP